MDLSQIHFHDCEIRRVIENPVADELLVEVDYPVDWEQNRFEPRVIAFCDVLGYTVQEGAFFGAPTILNVVALNQDQRRWLLRIETTAGYRTLWCASVEIRRQR